MTLLAMFFNTDTGRWETEAPVVIPNSVVLLHLNGVDASTVFTNDGSNGATFSAGNAAQIDTFISKFGGASLVTGNVTTDYIISTDFPHLPTSGGWTVDLWFRFNSSSPGSNAGLFRYHKSGEASGGLYLGYNAGTQKINWAIGENTTYNIQALTDWTTGDVSDGVMHHLAAVYDSADGKYYGYLDGVKQAEVTSALNINSGNTNDTVVIASNSGATPFYGWIDEVRAVASCAFPGGTTFTPPTTEYTI